MLRIMKEEEREREKKELTEARREALVAYDELEFETILKKFQPAVNKQLKSRIRAAKTTAAINEIMQLATMTVDQYLDKYDQLVKDGLAHYKYDAQGELV